MVVCPHTIMCLFWHPTWITALLFFKLAFGGRKRLDSAQLVVFPASPVPDIALDALPFVWNILCAIFLERSYRGLFGKWEFWTIHGGLSVLFKFHIPYLFTARPLLESHVDHLYTLVILLISDEILKDFSGPVDKDLIVDRQVAAELDVFLEFDLFALIEHLRIDVWIYLTLAHFPHFLPSTTLRLTKVQPLVKTIKGWTLPPKDD